MKVLLNIEVIILVCILFIIVYGHLFVSCLRKDPYSLLEGMASKKSSTKSNSTTKPSTNKKEGFHNRSDENDFQPLMFKNAKFAPECCPTTYTNSMGCACITPKLYSELITRGGNNVPYSEY